MRRRSVCLGIVAPLLAALLLTGTAVAAPPDQWVGSYAAAPGFTNPVPPVGSTFRVLAMPHLGGETVRLRLSNRFGNRPLQIDAVTVAPSVGQSAAVVAHELRAVTFAGRPSIAIAPGADLASDPIPLRIKAFQLLSVSIFVTSVDLVTEHLDAHQLSWLAPGANAAADTGSERYTVPYPSAPILCGIDVAAAPGGRTIVAFGDSITDGFHALPMEVLTLGANQRYPDYLARRLAAAGATHIGVVNAGISGNQVTQGPSGLEWALGYGPPGVDRFARDALGVPGVSDVLLALGSNDLARGLHAPAAPEQVIAGLQRMIAQAHAAGVRVHLATLTPRTDFEAPPPDSIQTVNRWIRAQRESDSILDFDALLRDPANPFRLAPQFDSGDGLHPNPAGYQRLAGGIDLGVLQIR